MSIKVVGTDLAKNFFQVFVLNIDGTISSNRKVPRDKLLHQSVNFQIIPHWLWNHVLHHTIGDESF